MVTNSAEFYSKAPPDKGASSFVYPPTQPNLEFFANALKSGCLVAIPTETVYGLAGMALDESACRSIFKIKGRPLVDPLIVHVENASMVNALAEVNEPFTELQRVFWPGPLTMILNKKQIVPDLVTAGKPTVAIRSPNHPVAIELINKTGTPLAAPSANPFGYISPSRAQHVADSFGSLVPFIIDGGSCKFGLESTILDISNPENPCILRPGAISPQQISNILKMPVNTKSLELEATETATAPGTFSRHYSPKIRMSTFAAGKTPEVSSKEAVVFLKRNPSFINNTNVYWLSETGSLKDVASSLYNLLRKIDKLEYTAIHCEYPTELEDGYAIAIRDRLFRAAAK